MTITTFTIIKGEDLEFDIIVKENGTLLPLVLDPADTFTYTLTDKKQKVKYAENIPMSILDADAGKVRGVITAAISATLPTKKAAAEDYFIMRPSLMLVIQGHSVTQGDMTAFINDVYVVEG